MKKRHQTTKRENELNELAKAIAFRCCIIATSGYDIPAMPTAVRQTAISIARDIAEEFGLEEEPEWA